MIFNRLHSVISQKMVLFITTTARSSNPTYMAKMFEADWVELSAK
jgi:hypothetical protein